MKCDYGADEIYAPFVPFVAKTVSRGLTPTAPTLSSTMKSR